ATAVDTMPIAAWQGPTRYGPVLRRTPITRNGHEMPNGTITQAMLRDAESDHWADHTDGAYGFRHAGNGMKGTVWMRKNGVAQVLTEQREK
ncbi:MAG: hypothetical protein ACKPKO_61505, partial [Candidatus Fonsibacter sp.]